MVDKSSRKYLNYVTMVLNYWTHTDRKNWIYMYETFILSEIWPHGKPIKA